VFLSGFPNVFRGFSSGATIENIGFLRVRIDWNIAKTFGFSLLSSAIAPSFPKIFLGFQSASIALSMFPKTGRRGEKFFTNLARVRRLRNKRKIFSTSGLARFGPVWHGLAMVGQV
jgi:hypothetical protein